MNSLIEQKSDLAAYLKMINSFPMLSAEEEHDLAVKFHETGDKRSAYRLVMSHMRFVVHIAKGYLGYGLPLKDLIQEGAIGLMQAIKRFNPSNGVRLATYAMHWIKSEIHEFILNNWKLVKVATTKAQRKLFFNLKKYKKNVQWLSNEEVSKVASDLEVTPKDVTEMELKMSDSEVSYDADEPEILCLEDKRSDFAKIIENNDYKNTLYKNLKNALQSLDERSRFIIQKRYLEEQCTLTELSKTLNISIERVRQIENNALKLLKVYMGNKNV